jgi:catechol 2,3-dioxygenase
MEAFMTDAFFDHSTAPMQIGRVRLRVHDLGKVAAFYQKVLGLTVIDRAGDVITLAAGAVPLLELTGAPLAARRDPRDAGLFHTAFLLPSRADLARWLAHARKLGVTLQGASDHIVSEAVYLADPEGNGIEIYADRPVSQWRDTDGNIQMATAPLDIPDLMIAGQGEWVGFPEGARIGHLHLQVGDIAAAESFFCHIIGFDITCRYPGASFFGSGGYHHQFAANIWNSRQARQRTEGAVGLEFVEIILRDPAFGPAILARADAAGARVSTIGQHTLLRDPWATAIAIKQ